MLKLIEYLNNYDIEMIITPSRMKKYMPTAVDVQFIHGDIHWRFVVDTEAVAASHMSFEDILIDRLVEFMRKCRVNATNAVCKEYEHV